MAADALKADARRRNRENAAMESLFESKGSSQWDEIEPILDGAMGELPERDRDLVLLRYFENKSFKEIAAAVGISDDAAQKRVGRALEKLREIFGKRGVKVTSTGLAAALLASATQAAPAALTATVTALTGASTAAVGLSIFSQIPLMTMNIKTAAAIVLVIGAVSTAIVVKEHNAAAELREQNETLHATVQRLESEPASVAASGTQVDAVEIARLRKEAAEVHGLRAQVASLTGGDTRPVATGTRPRGVVAAKPEIASNSTIDDWMKIGNDLIKQGKQAEALEYYLWCYDEGMKTEKPSLSVIRTSFLLSNIAELAKNYEPARAAMEERRKALETSVTESSQPDEMAVLELIELNKTVGDPAKSMGLFDQLSATHPARTPLIEHSMEQFIRAGRYQDIVSFSNPEASLDRALTIASFHTTREGDARYQAHTRRNVVKSGGWAIEALSGVGQAERARSVLDKVLKYDSSPETKGELLKYAQRGGNAAMVELLQR